MLDISKVQFVTTTDEARPWQVKVMGGIKINSEICVDSHRVPPPPYRDAIREAIWNSVYGDIRKPLMELEDIALAKSRPELRDRVEKLCGQLNTLLSMPIMEIV